MLPSCFLQQCLPPSPEQRFRNHEQLVIEDQHLVHHLLPLARLGATLPTTSLPTSLPASCRCCRLGCLCGCLLLWALRPGPQRVSCLLCSGNSSGGGAGGGADVAAKVVDAVGKDVLAAVGGAHACLGALEVDQGVLQGKGREGGGGMATMDARAMDIASVEVGVDVVEPQSAKGQGSRSGWRGMVKPSARAGQSTSGKDRRKARTTGATPVSPRARHNPSVEEGRVHCSRGLLHRG